MKLTDKEIEARLRRTLAAVADAPLDDADELSARRGFPRRAAVALAIAASVATLSAIAFVDRGPRETIAAGTGEEGPTLADYRATPDEVDLLFRADQRAMRLCMERAGQPYAEVESDRSGDLDPHWNRLGRTNRDRADRLGYVAGPGAGGAHPSQKGLHGRDLEGWERAFWGEDRGDMTGPSVPVFDPVSGKETGRQAAGGCFGEVQRDLYVDQSRHTSLESFITNELGGRVEHDAIGDRRFRDAISGWASCMKEKGHDFDGPFDPINRHGVDPAPGRPTRDERATALADVACKESTSAVRIYEDLLAEHGRVVAAEHGRLLREYRAILDRALSRAKEVLGEDREHTRN